MEKSCTRQVRTGQDDTLLPYKTRWKLCEDEILCCIVKGPCIYTCMRVYANMKGTSEVTGVPSLLRLYSKTRSDAAG